MPRSPLPNESLHSPIEERHIDFLLEEEFASNPEFLAFFVEVAKRSTSVAASRFPVDPHQEWCCSAVRSVTTSAGESDVLVRYAGQALGQQRVALLIENKITAQFQDGQAMRYIERGESGVGQAWDTFWTCLVAPSSYRAGLAGFDARVDLEEIARFFSVTDVRTLFKHRTCLAAIDRQRSRAAIDPIMTKFRQNYAHAAQSRFGGTLIYPEEAHEAWADDCWFAFTSPKFEKGVKLIHKPKSGVVQLNFPHTNVSELSHRLALAEEAGITLRQTHQSASFELSVPVLSDFSEGKTSLLAYTTEALEAAFDAVTKLYTFETSATIYPEQMDSYKVLLLAIQDILHGLIRSRSRQFGVQPPALMPSLVGPDQRREQHLYWNIPGIAGGFEIAVRETKDREPRIYAESGSRIWDQHMRHLVTPNGIESEAIDYLEEVGFHDWVQSKLQT